MAGEKFVEQFIKQNVMEEPYFRVAAVHQIHRVIVYVCKEGSYIGGFVRSRATVDADLWVNLGTDIEQHVHVSRDLPYKTIVETRYDEVCMVVEEIFAEHLLPVMQQQRMPFDIELWEID